MSNVRAEKDYAVAHFGEGRVLIKTEIIETRGALVLTECLTMPVGTRKDIVETDNPTRIQLVFRGDESVDVMIQALQIIKAGMARARATVDHE